MNLALAKGAGTNTHVLRSVPQTIHWGFFDGALAPVLTIDSGDCVVVECVSGNPEWMPAKSSGFEVLPELRQIHEQGGASVIHRFLEITNLERDDRFDA